LSHTPKVTNVASQLIIFYLLMPILTLFVALFSWKNQLLLKTGKKTWIQREVLQEAQIRRPQWQRTFFWQRKREPKFIWKWWG